MNLPKGDELLVQVFMCPFFRTVLHEDLRAGLRVSFGRLHHATCEPTLQTVGKSSALRTLDQGEAMFLKHLLSMFQLLELHEGKVEVLEERPISKKHILSLPNITVI